MKTVILKRAPALPDLVFDFHLHDASARTRADALADLHGARVTEDGDTINIWAEAYYNKGWNEQLRRVVGGA